MKYLHPKDLAQVLLLDGKDQANAMIHEFAAKYRPKPKNFEVFHLAQQAKKLAEGV